MPIDQDRMEAAMTYLADTDEPYAEEKTQLERCEILCKRVRARIFLTTDGTVAERNAQSETHPEVTAEDEAYCVTMKVYETMKAKRERAELVIDVWRTLEASRRKS